MFVTPNTPRVLSLSGRQGVIGGGAYLVAIFSDILSDMKVYFSTHAIDQMAERKIPRVAVIQCARNPDKLEAQESSRFRAVKKIVKAGQAQLLVVVYERVKGDLRIVTAFYTSKTKKYL